MWRPSPSPEETWSDASGGNEYGEWPVKAVVGEEIRLDGTSRYEVRWGNWYRKDGSNTTWETENFERVGLIRRWNRAQRHTRVDCAELSLDMEVSWPDDAIHKRLTDHRRQGYDEKLEKKRRAGPTSTVNWDQEVEVAYGRLQEPERGEANSKLRVRRANQTSASASLSVLSTPSNRRKRSPQTSTTYQSISAAPARKRSRARINNPPASSSPRSAATTSSALTRKGTTSLTPNSASSSKEPETARNTLPYVTVSQPTLRGRTSSSWNRAAKEAMAATVRISPDISDYDFPRNLRKFTYLEKGYVFRDDDLQDTFDVSCGAFTRCDCAADNQTSTASKLGTCSEHSDCSCLDLNGIYDLGGRFSAYSGGLFAFKIPRGVEVVECNKYCKCSRRCGNRVAQLPRDIGIEIFDTDRCGWGVRALDNIPQGKVLGTYTGMIVRRDSIDDLPEEHQGYLFDLDSTEVKNSENLGGKYTVDSYEYGNWTRFVNHSCSPNMQVYSVVYDTIPYVNMPYVAFVASVDIRAGTELTIDYHPYANEEARGKRSANGGDCKCNSVDCRGWLQM